jgi:hypothetical protein
MLISHHQNAGQTHDIMMANRSLENLAKLKYLETTVRNQNFIHEEIKSRLTLGISYCYLVQNLFLHLFCLRTNLKHTDLYFACSFVWA